MRRVRVPKDELRCLRENLQEAWAALRIIREAVETLGPIGAMRAEEHLDGPTLMHEAEAIVEGIKNMTNSKYFCSVPSRFDFEPQTIGAASGWEARKLYAARQGIIVRDVIARRLPLPNADRDIAARQEQAVKKLDLAMTAAELVDEHGMPYVVEALRNVAVGFAELGDSEDGRWSRIVQTLDRATVDIVKHLGS